jgi:hypothetical protein
LAPASSRRLNIDIDICKHSSPTLQHLLFQPLPFILLIRLSYMKISVLFSQTFYSTFNTFYILYYCLHHSFSQHSAYQKPCNYSPVTQTFGVQVLNFTSNQVVSPAFFVSINMRSLFQSPKHICDSLISGSPVTSTFHFPSKFTVLHITSIS